MLTVLACLEQDHNLWLTLLAAVVCLIGCHVTVSILARARGALGRPQGGPTAGFWLVGGAVAFGAAVWSTHFVAMLAYAPALGATFDVTLTAASLLVAIGGSLAVFGIQLRQRINLRRAAVAGAMLGSTIFAMHFIGMRALSLPGIITYAPSLVVLSWLIGCAAATAALLLAATRPVSCVALLVFAVVGLHFTGMASVTILRLAGDPPAPEPTVLLAIAVAAVCLLILLPALAGVLFDRHLERRSQQEEGRLRQFAESSFEGILFHRDGVITDINAMLCRRVGATAAALIGRKVDSLFAPECHGAVARALAAQVSAVTDVTLLDAAGHGHPAELLSRIIAAEDQAARTGPTGVLGLRDLTERRASERQIQHLAHYDTLTGVANRLLFQDHILAALSRPETRRDGLALLAIDLDRFKSVNDLLGHPVGDQLLVQVAARLTEATRRTDTVARLGGDEFAILQCGASRQDAIDLAERLSQAIAAPFLLDGHNVRIGSSIGISLLADDAETAETLMQRADLALYQAKQGGRGDHCLFEPVMARTQQERLLLEQDLMQAMGLGQFVVYYQPQFSADGLSLAGYEALLRWQHPVRGMVPPGVFIPLAEACGLIVELGNWVLETACAEAAGWDGNYVIAVNLSPVQLRQDDLAQVVAGILQRTGLDPRRLELEVTEGVLINDPAHARTTLLALKQQGIRIALDDYGTGYSSLNYLSNFSFDKIKIDGSYVRNLGAKNAEIIIGSIIELGHGLAMTVTAEGVETDAQLRALRNQGCDELQGYLLGRPAPRDRLHHRVAPQALAPAA